MQNPKARFLFLPDPEAYKRVYFSHLGKIYRLCNVRCDRERKVREYIRIIR